ncbi:MAG: efflux transporter outer membrane subunit [Pseudomonadota bacterium]|nr:efflux transporter outer membrane subunit [Pseudomonadota bacterium]
MTYRLWVGLGSALLLQGCDFAPDYQAPAVAMASQFSDAPGGGTAVGAYWWRSFRDSTLDRLEADVDAANPDLAAALGAYQAAQARTEAATSGLFPEIDFGGTLSGNKQSANRPLRSSRQPTYFGANQIFAGVASYELDVWSRIGDLVKAAHANEQAASDALANARAELHAELARDYIDLRGLDAQAKLLADTITVYRSALQLTRERLNAKIAPPIDEQRAETQLDGAEAQASDLGLRRAALVDAIATLAGKSAAGFHLPTAPASIGFPRRPRAVPGDVLRRRPDVAQAEHEAIAASALIGAARAAEFPKFSIGLLGGTQDTGLNLLSLPNSMFSVGPSISAPIFDFGLREAQLKEAQAQFKIAAEHYRSTVLRALKEVQDDLSALRWLADESRQSDAAAAAASRALDMSMALYRDGAASYLDVVTAQNAALDAHRAAIGVRTRQLESNVALILALGGGWSASAPDETTELKEAHQ